VGQLYLGGPRDKFTTFISAEKTAGDVTISENPLMPGLVEGIYGKKASEIMAAILGGVKAAYSNQKLPFMEVTLENISEESIGEFLQFKMIEMMYLGKLLNVNTFDQPHVELYKVETKKLLSK
jgi:glucose-6-phosphate isomerase